MRTGKHGVYAESHLTDDSATGKNPDAPQSRSPASPRLIPFRSSSALRGSSMES
jgi:hypothetical protein